MPTRTTDTETNGNVSTDAGVAVTRRTLMRTAGALAAIAGLSGAAAARHATTTNDTTGYDWPGYDGHLDPVHGYASLGPVPDWFPERLAPAVTVDAFIDFDPAEGYGFYFEPAGVHVRPGEVLMLRMASPEHAFTAYSSGFGRQNRLPAGVGPVSSPILPFMPPSYEGYWLYRFVHEGVYDYFCPPHEIIGMAGRVVVYDDEGDGTVPSADFGDPGEFERPPEHVNLLNVDEALTALEVPPFERELPSAAEVLDSGLLTPGAIVEAGAVSYLDVADAFAAGEGEEDGGEGEES